MDPETGRLRLRPDRSNGSQWSGTTLSVFVLYIQKVMRFDNLSTASTRHTGHRPRFASFGPCESPVQVCVAPFDTNIDKVRFPCQDQGVRGFIECSTRPRYADSSRDGHGCTDVDDEREQARQIILKAQFAVHEKRPRVFWLQAVLTSDGHGLEPHGPGPEAS
jgi:hypothetical protein